MKTDDQVALLAYAPLVRKLANLSGLSFAQEAPAGAVSFVLGGNEFFIPLDIQVDAAVERARVEKELGYAIGFRDSVNKKLGIILDEATHKWGVKVNRVEQQDITPPADVQHAMEKQMRAERESAGI